MSYSRAQRTQAQKKANELANNAPGAYASPYQQKINSTLEKINSRKPFSYDFNADALYNRYKDLYEQVGETAMMDAQADAAALTGGFENSYGASAGQKAYQQMLQNASNAIPELQNNALSRYNAEGEELYNRLSAYQNAESLAYQKYQNDLNNYYNALDYWNSIASSRGRRKTKNPYIDIFSGLTTEEALSKAKEMFHNNKGKYIKDNDLIQAAIQSETTSIHGNAYPDIYSSPKKR